MEFKKLSAVEMVEAVDQAATVLIEKDGVIKRAPKNEINVQADWAETRSSSPAFIKNKPSKELVYEWNFSADDEVYEIYENVDEDLSWLTKRQDNIGFEIVIENCGYDYRWSEEEGNHDYVFYENMTSTTSSAEVPYYSRYTNIPCVADSSVIVKEVLSGWVSGNEINAHIEDTDKEFRLQP